MKINKTVLGVVVFIILLVGATYQARAEDGVRISLGHTVFNSESTVGEVSYEYNDWEASVAQIGAGSTKNGDQDLVDVWSISHVIRPQWGFWGVTNYYRLGVAYLDDSPLVGNTNFRLGIGLEHKHIQLEFGHYSSAGIHDPNTGVDFIQLRYKIPVN